MTIWTTWASIRPTIRFADLEITVTGDLTAVAGRALADLLAVGECAASGPVRELYKRRSEADAVTAIHHHAVFAEDALRMIADKTRAQFPTVTQGNLPDRELRRAFLRIPLPLCRHRLMRC